MLCPMCRSEFPEGVTICPDCDAPLVETLPETAEEPNMDIVEVLQTGNEALVPFVKSLLDDVGIEYMVKSDNLQDLFGWGRLGSAYNYIVGPVRFFVRADDFERAAALLDALDDEPPPESNGN